RSRRASYRTDVFGPAVLEVALSGDQVADSLSERGFGLRDISAGHFADAKPILSCLKLLTENRHVVAVYLDQRLVAHYVEISLGYGLEHQGFDRQGLGSRRLYKVDRLAGLRHGAPPSVDRLVRCDG